MTEGGQLKQYETTIVMDAQLKDEGWEQAIDKYSGIIKRDGSIVQIDRWGVRRLAYEIDKQTHGYYVHLIHESSPAVLRELDRQFKLDENCLRYLTVVADNPKYVEEMNKAKARQAASESESAEQESSPRKEPEERPAASTSTDTNPRAEKTEEQTKKPAADATDGDDTKEKEESQ